MADTNTSSSLYESIGVPVDATTEEIKAACMRLGAAYRPDRAHIDKHAAENFRDIERAYAVLTDPVKRGLYDKELALSTPTVSDSRHPVVAAIGGGIAGIVAGGILILASPFLAALASLVMLGWIVGPIAVVIGVVVVLAGPLAGVFMNRKAYQGHCPYCASRVRGIRSARVAGQTCKVCKKRMTYREGRLHRLQ